MNTDGNTVAQTQGDDSARRFNLLAVDDMPENLDILVSSLSDLYHVQGATSGETALKIVARHKPDLILLDVMMPGIDGFETCRRLKKNKETADIPVIFVTSLHEVKDERVGFAAGGVDYINKPSVPSILLARVKTHLELSEARRNIQNILNQTLAGTISIMTEVLSLANPLAFSRALRLRKLIQEIVKQIGRPDAWQFELSAILSQLGCITLPTNVLQNFQRGIIASAENQERYEHYPELSAKLVSHIPRLEEIAQMVKTHLTPPCAPFLGDLQTRPAAVLGAQILKLTIDYDTQKLYGISSVMAIRRFRRDRRDYDPLLVTILESVVMTEKEEQEVMLHGLRVGMVLAADMVDREGGCVMRQGTELTVSILNLIHSLNRESTIQQPILVLVPVEQHTAPSD
ncbi:MAG: response regulator [Magnetococcales bacterium]|nr:response regulator [Magnetococcales bacterium]